MFCYTLGKAQRLLAELARVTDRPVLVHGMMVPMIDAYRARGVVMLATRDADRTPARHVAGGRAGARPALGARHAVDAAAR